jgi:Tfp pilus assembly protein PilF
MEKTDCSPQQSHRAHGGALMDKWQKLLGSTLAAVSIAAAGCSGTSSFKNLFAKGDKPPAKKQSLVRAGQGIGHRGPVEKKGFSESVASSWKSMTGKVSDALTIKPKQVKAPDPVSLDSNPGPLNPELFVATAAILEGSRKFDQAQQQYDKALKIDPKNQGALIGIARLYDRQGKFQLAEKGYIRAIKAHPKQAEYFNDLGLCLARQKKSDLAASALSKAVELDPKKVLFRNNLATVLVATGKHDEALKQFTAAQDEATAHYNLGYLLYKRNENEAAIRHLQIAQQMKPDFVQAKQMLAKLGAGQPARDNNRTYRITDREQVANYSTKPQIPARLTSGIMLSRLPTTEDEDVDEHATLFEEPQDSAPAIDTEQPKADDSY